MKDCITKYDIVNTEQTLTELFDADPSLFGDASIDSLNLPPRPQKRVAMLGLSKISELLRVKVIDLLSINGMGLRSFNEIAAALSKRLSSAPEEELSNLSEEKPTDPLDFSTIRIEELDLSPRSYNCLKKSGITTLSQLLDYTEEDLLRIKNLGSGSAKEILDIINDTALTIRISRKKEADRALQELDESIEETSEDLAHCFGFDQIYWRKLLEAERIRIKTTNIQTIIDSFYHRSDIEEILSAHIKRLVAADGGEISFEQLWVDLPAHLQNTGIIENALSVLCSNELIRITDDTIIGIYPSVIDYVNGLTDVRTRDIITAKLDGKTLEEIGAQYGGLTRERVRQLIAKAIKRFPRLDEDKYRYLYSKYDISAEDFRIAFNEQGYVYNYLDMTDHIKRESKLPLIDALDDQNISEDDRVKIEKAVYKDYILLNGSYIKKARPELLKWYIRTYCRSITGINDLVDDFNAMLEEQGLDVNALGIQTAATIENHLLVSDDVLWGTGRRFRAYDIVEYDIDHLWDELGIEQYRGLEISALLLFRANKELMEEYDLHDEYELHNLLKKTAGSRIDGLSFGRMPIISVGDSSREEQMLELLIENAPIEADSLFERYEEEYGLRKELIAYNYLNSFGEYFHNGKFSVDSEQMPSEMMRKLNEILDGDYYTIESVKRIFKAEYPNESPALLNAYNLKLLGFKICSGYIVSGKYASAADCFKTILTRDGLVDLTKEIDTLRRFVSFTTEMYTLIAEREITEILPGRFINIKRLNELGITAEALNDFCRRVHEFVPDGALFTVTKLKNDRFSHPIWAPGFGEYFYASVLSGDISFSCQRTGGTRLFRNGKKAASVKELIGTIVKQHKKIGIEVVDYILKNEYGIFLNQYKLPELIRVSEMYYNAITKVVYENYEAFVNEA